MTVITWRLKALMVSSRNNEPKLLFTAIRKPEEKQERQQGPMDPLLGVFEPQSEDRVQELVPVPVG